VKYTTESLLTNRAIALLVIPPTGKETAATAAA